MGWEETREKSRKTFFTSLYEKHYYMLHWLAFQYTYYDSGDDRIGDDVIVKLVEETFEKAIPHYDEIRVLKPAERLTFLKNTMRCVLAGHRDHTNYELDTIPLSAMIIQKPMNLEELDAFMEAKRERQGARIVMNAIKPEDLWLLYYRYMAKYSDEEIAAALEIPKRYVNTFFERADSRVRRYMAEADFGYIHYEAKLRQQELRKARMDNEEYGEKQAMYEMKRLVEVFLDDCEAKAKKKKQKR